MRFRRTLVTLAAAGAVLSIPGVASAHDDPTQTTVAVGANNGSVGFTAAHTTFGPLTDPNNHQVQHYCNFTVNGVGNTITLTIVAEATAGPHLVAVSTGIYCEVWDDNGVFVDSVALALPGVQVAVAKTTGLIQNNGPYTVCTIGSGQWVDTHQLTTAKNCQQPNLPPLPVKI